MTASGHPQTETVVRVSPWFWALIYGGFPVIGAAAGWGLVELADWVVGLPWAPMQGLFEVIHSWQGMPLTIGAIAVGAVAGLVLAFTAAHENLTVTVGSGRVVLRRKGADQVVERATVSGAFLDGKQLVIHDKAGGELARAPASDLDVAALAAAFREHGCAWHEGGDPYAADFRFWVDGIDGLPPGANALLKARSLELTKSEGGDADELRIELARLGVVVRDDRRRQYWRLTRS